MTTTFEVTVKAGSAFATRRLEHRSLCDPEKADPLALLEESVLAHPAIGDLTGAAAEVHIESGSLESDRLGTGSVVSAVYNFVHKDGEWVPGKFRWTDKCSYHIPPARR